MDLIDKRNKKEKMANSIIKRRNVVYTVPQQSNEQEQLLKAEEILNRLVQEQHQDEEKWHQEIEQLLMEQERNQVEIDRILREKQVHLEKTMRDAEKGVKYLATAGNICASI